MKAEDILKEIKYDNLSGASEILFKAKDCLITYSGEVQSSSNEGYLKLLSSFGKRMVDAQPSMAPLFNYVNHVLLCLEDSQDGSMDVPQLKERTVPVSEEYISNSQNAQRKIEEQIFNIVENGHTIMTHSYSSTVIRSLTNAQANGKDLAVVVPESRPGLEGRKTARILSEGGIRTTLMADMAAFGFIKEIDMVLVGCDTLCKQGVVNKIGTSGLALVAKNQKRPFYVAGDSGKFLPSIYRNRPEIENMDPNEIMTDPGSIEIRNLYFDTTSYDHITGIINEDGIQQSHRMASLLDGLRVSEILLD
jgi:translation initiation factor 2B subunit (eIF-2B alpha/beta/delta family)